MLLVSFSHQRFLVDFHLGLSDKKSRKVSRTRLSILVDLSNAVIWIVSVRSPISNSSSPLNCSFSLKCADRFYLEHFQTFHYYFQSIRVFHTSVSTVLLSLASILGKSPGELRRFVAAQTLVKNHNKYYYCHYHYLRIFHTSVSWWFLTWIN